jgi:FkbM family methyltransferase
MARAEQAEKVRAGLTRAMLANHLSELLARQPINCVIDVGAHRGEYGRMLRGIGYTGPIVSFEPVESTFRELQNSMAASPPWTGRRLALGGGPGETRITVFEEETSFSAGPEPTPRGRQLFSALRGKESAEVVEVQALDDLFGEITSGISDPRVLLKVDVQGQEWDVLGGAAETLLQVSAAQVEAAVIPVYEGVRPYTEVLELLGRSGLELSGLFPVSRDDDLRIIELDCLVVRPRVSR